jgi:hypothetical protein
MEDQQEEVIEKKRPGRPKKKIEKKEVVNDGIVNVPLNKHLEETEPNLVNVVEIVYTNPMMMRKIFHLFKIMSVENVTMQFNKTHTKLYGIDNLEKNEIYVKIFGDKMNRYYCEEPLEISFGPRNINKILQTLTKDHGQIILAITRQYKRSRILFILTNDEIEEDSINNIEIDNIEHYDWIIEKELKKEKHYPIKFELPAKYFKKKISDIEPLTDILRIEKTGFSPLKWTYNFKDKKGFNETPFKNPWKINMRSTIDEEEIFSTSVCLEHIRPFSSSLIADEIHISADKEHNLIFTAYLDQDESPLSTTQKKCKLAGTERCIIKVVTEIIKSSRNN